MRKSMIPCFECRKGVAKSHCRKASQTEVRRVKSLIQNNLRCRNAHCDVRRSKSLCANGLEVSQIHPLKREGGVLRHHHSLVS